MTHNETNLLIATSRKKLLPLLGELCNKETDSVVDRREQLPESGDDGPINLATKLPERYLRDEMTCHLHYTFGVGNAAIRCWAKQETPLLSRIGKARPSVVLAGVVV